MAENTGGEGSGATSTTAGGAPDAQNTQTGTGANGSAGTGTGNAQTQNAAQATQNGAGIPSAAMSTEALDKYINERVVQATAALNKEKSSLQKALDKANRENKSAEEIRDIENQRRENELAEREREIKARENKIFAMEQIKKVGLDKGGIEALELADLVVADSEEDMTARVNTLSKLVKALVKSEVDETFKLHGRNPGSGDSGAGKEKPENTLAKKLGEQAAERNKRAQSVLDFYK